jgi:hypothetical protein
MDPFIHIPVSPSPLVLACAIKRAFPAVHPRAALGVAVSICRTATRLERVRARAEVKATVERMLRAWCAARDWRRAVAA